MSTKWTVWSSSLMSAWTATSMPSLKRDSKATMSSPASRLESKVNSSSASPEAVLALKVVVAVTGLPSASSNGSPVDFTMRVPVTVYSVPSFFRFSYQTVSTRVVSAEACATWSPSALSVSSVWIFGPSLSSRLIHTGLAAVESRSITKVLVTRS